MSNATRETPSPTASTYTKIPVVPKQFLVSFILTTCCFSLWGFANDFTNPLVKVFEQVFIIGTSQASWLQFAFYTGYFCMAIPAALFIRRYSYKAAIILGLTLYGVGALITIPASLTATFWVFCLASYVITYGLAFLETSCNPYILAMGPPETATQRLNLAQAFNPIGSLTGMAVATFILAPSLQVGEFRAELGQNNPAYTQYLLTDAENLPAGATVEGDSVTLPDGNVVSLYANGVPTFADELPGVLDGAVPNALKTLRATEPAEFKTIQQADLGFVRTPYMVIASVVFIFLILFSFSKMPLFRREEKDAPFFVVTGHLLRKPHFREGVLAQGFYVGAQIMCWTFIIHYGMEQVGLDLATAQKWNIAAMIIFLCSRFICTFLLRFVSPGKLLFLFSSGGFAFTVGAIFLPGYIGLSCLVLISGCMSLMFPTIYGIALKDLREEEAKLGSAYLIMSIVGGAVLTKLQGGLIENFGVRTSFWLPAACFILIGIFAYRTYGHHEKKTA
ncbi:MFS transporter [Pelagicoccus albus]|uniref:MFS transporter n=1 Tax=Pelagicoccus albus TaxID=415222 RepID=A0A7X1B4G3_9BACT|nr:MFS transporter [Pelagicoccus albus]MBC2605457.1 MFS transporter [Pelagicoccus albus]